MSTTIEFWTSGAPLCPPQRKEIVIPFAAANWTYTNALYQLSFSGVMRDEGKPYDDRHCFL